jgi:hypothetical protein
MRGRYVDDLAVGQLESDLVPSPPSAVEIVGKNASNAY